MQRGGVTKTGLRGSRRGLGVSVVRRVGLFVIFVFLAVPAGAEWRVDFESKVVEPGQTGVTVDLTVAWDDTLLGLTIPLVVREIDPGSFWAGPLPYDTGANASNHPHAQGVTWNWVTPWASMVEEVKPIAGMPSGYRCVSSRDDEYEGVSPDHLAINALGASLGAAPQPLGRAIVTITFAVTEQPGQFEIDTSCFTTALQTLTMIDGRSSPVDHGPGGTDEVVFTKGVITIASPGGILEADDTVPAEYELAQNYPNPFNAGTHIEFSLPQPGIVRLEVFDILGRSVITLVDGPKNAGRQQAFWNGEDYRGERVGSGIYFYRLAVGDRLQMRKMLLLE
jgi:hypothetical protein